MLRLTTSADGRRFTRPRAMAGVLPNWLGRDDPAYVSDLDLTLDATGNPVLALAAWHRPGPARRSSLPPDFQPAFLGVI